MKNINVTIHALTSIHMQLQSMFTAQRRRCMSLVLANGNDAVFWNEQARMREYETDMHQVDKTLTMLRKYDLIAVTATG